MPPKKTNYDVPVELVLAAFRRWQAEDPEAHTMVLADERTGLSYKWFQRLESEPDRNVPFDAVDHMVTRLDLIHEWPTLMQADAPEELVERRCDTCCRSVLADADEPHRCVWCRNPTTERGLADPHWHGPNNISMSVLREAYDLYCTPMPLRDVAVVLGHRTRYASVHSFEVNLRTAFRRMGWAVRSGQLSGPHSGSWGKGSGIAHIDEARVLYERGYCVREVAEIMWPRLGYASMTTAISSITEAFKRRGWPLRTTSEAKKGRNTTHGAYSRGDKAAIKALRDARRYAGQEQCQQPRCPNRAPRGATHCRLHDDEAAALHEQAMRQRALTRGYLPVKDVIPILAAWKATGRGGMKVLAYRSGVQPGTLTRWLNQTDETSLAKPELVQQVLAVGLPDV